MNMKRTMRCAALMLAGTLSVAAGSTEVAAETPARTVRFADLDLNSAAGVDALYRRIEHAADLVCGNAGDTRQLAILQAAKECRQRATDRAIRQVGVSALTNLHFAKNGRVKKPEQLAAE